MTSTPRKQSVRDRGNKVKSENEMFGLIINGILVLAIFDILSEMVFVLNNQLLGLNKNLTGFIQGLQSSSCVSVSALNLISRSVCIEEGQEQNDPNQQAVQLLKRHTCALYCF